MCVFAARGGAACLSAAASDNQFHCMQMQPGIGKHRCLRRELAFKKTSAI